MSVALRVGVLVWLVAVFQTAVFADIVLLGGTPDVLLVAVISTALLRGSVAGALAGFLGGLVVDVATLGTLGVTALVMTLAGFWAGRYGETTGRDRAHAPLLAVIVITLLVGIGSYLLYFLLGESVSARDVLVVALPPTLGLNVLVAVPVYVFVRRVIGTSTEKPRPEVELVV